MCIRDRLKENNISRRDLVQPYLTSSSHRKGNHLFRKLGHLSLKRRGLLRTLLLGQVQLLKLFFLQGHLFFQVSYDRAGSVSNLGLHFLYFNLVLGFKLLHKLLWVCSACF